VNGPGRLKKNGRNQSGRELKRTGWVRSENSPRQAVMAAIMINKDGNMQRAHITEVETALMRERVRIDTPDC
jgi:hypothetical protein